MSDLLRSFVVGLVRSGKPFTSVEVANNIKMGGTWIRNRDVARFLRTSVLEIANELGLQVNASLIGVNNEHDATKTYLYHPDDFNSDEYNARELRAITPDEFKEYERKVNGNNHTIKFE